MTSQWHIHTTHNHTKRRTIGIQSRIQQHNQEQVYDVVASELLNADTAAQRIMICYWYHMLMSSRQQTCSRVHMLNDSLIIVTAYLTISKLQYYRQVCFPPSPRCATTNFKATCSEPTELKVLCLLVTSMGKPELSCKVQTAVCSSAEFSYINFCSIIVQVHYGFCRPTIFFWSSIARSQTKPLRIILGACVQQYSCEFDLSLH